MVQLWGYRQTGHILESIIWVPHPTDSISAGFSSGVEEKVSVTAVICGTITLFVNRTIDAKPEVAFL